MPVLVINETHVCDVCRILEKDTHEKVCSRCELCDSWICVGCQNNWYRRAKAAILRKLETNYHGDMNYRTGSEFD